MELQGRIDQAGMAKILRYIPDCETPGRLLIKAKDRIGVVCFAAGRLTNVNWCCFELAELAGHRMVYLGLLEPEKRKQITTRSLEANASVQSIIAEISGLDELKVKEHILKLGSEIMSDFMTWPRGTYQFFLDDQTNVKLFRLNFSRLWDAALKLESKLKHAKKDFPLGTALLYKAKKEVEESASEPVKVLLSLIDGKRIANEIIAYSGIPKPEVYEFLTSLLKNKEIKSDDHGNLEIINDIDFKEIYKEILQTKRTNVVQPEPELPDEIESKTETEEPAAVPTPEAETKPVSEVKPEPKPEPKPEKTTEKAPSEKKIPSDKPKAPVHAPKDLKMETVINGDFGIEGDPKEIAEQVLFKINGIMTRVKLYPPTHPSLKNSVEKDHAYIKQILDYARHVTIQVKEDRILVNGIALEEGKKSFFQNFVTQLNKNEISSLTMLPGMRPDEMLNFLSILGMARIQIRDAGGLQKLIEERNLEHVAIDYLQYGVVAKGGVATAPVDDDMLAWQKVLNMAQLPDDFVKKIEDNPERIAKVVTSLAKAVGEGEDENLQVVSDRVAGTLQNVYQSLPAQAADAPDYSEKVQQFVQIVMALDPELRDAVLEKGLKEYDWKDVNKAITEILPDEDLVGKIVDRFASFIGEGGLDEAVSFDDLRNIGFEIGASDERIDEISPKLKEALTLKGLAQDDIIKLLEGLKATDAEKVVAGEVAVEISEPETPPESETAETEDAETKDEPVEDTVQSSDDVTDTETEVTETATVEESPETAPEDTEPTTNEADEKTESTEEEPSLDEKATTDKLKQPFTSEKKFRANLSESKVPNEIIELLKPLDVNDIGTLSELEKQVETLIGMERFNKFKEKIIESALEPKKAPSDKASQDSLSKDSGIVSESTLPKGQKKTSDVASKLEMYREGLRKLLKSKDDFTLMNYINSNLKGLKFGSASHAQKALILFPLLFEYKKYDLLLPYLSYIERADFRVMPIKTYLLFVELLGHLSNDEFPEAFQEIKNRSVKTLLTLLDKCEKQDYIRKKAIIRILGRVDSKAAKERLVKALEETEVSKEALEALRHDSREVSSQLLNMLLTEEKKEARMMIMELLESAGPGIEDEVLALTGDKRWYVRRNVCNLLEAVGSKKAAPHLRYLFNDKNPQVKEAALSALGKIAPMAIEDELIKMLEEEDEQVKLKAIQLIGKHGSVKGAKALHPLLKRRTLGIGDVPDNLKIEVCKSLGNIAVPESIPVLSEVLKEKIYFRSSRVQVHIAAAYGLGRIGDPSALEVLRKMTGSSHGSLSRAARRAIQMIEKGETEISEHVIKSEPEDTVKQDD